MAACQGSSPEHPEGEQVDFTFEQGGAVVAKGSVPVGGTVGADVPVGAETVVLLDGAPFGTLGPDPSGRGQAYVSNGEGCPASYPFEDPAGGDG